MSCYYSCGPPPPQKKNLTTSGGVRNTAFHEKNRFLNIFAIFAHFSMCSSEVVFGQTKMDFKNMREVFSHHELKNKNLSQFFQWSYEQGESKTSSRPIFPDSQFSVTVPILQELLRQLGTNLVKPKDVFVQNMPIYNNLLHFSPRCHRSREKHVCSDPFFFRRKPVRFSWQRAPNFVGVVAIFGRGG
jgi:hypothetical protein